MRVGRFDISLLSNEERSNCVGMENSDSFNKHLYSANIKELQSEGSIKDTQINLNLNAGGILKPLLTERNNTKLDEALKRLNEYNKELSKYQDNELIEVLESEVADIISLLQSERVVQYEEINRLNKEIQRLNKIIDKENINWKCNSVQEAKMKGLEDLLHKMHKDCFHNKNLVLKLQDILKHKDFIIEELEEKCKRLQNEVAYFKGTLDGKDELSAEQVSDLRLHAKDEVDLRRWLDDIKTERRLKDIIINKRGNVQYQDEGKNNGNRFGELMRKVQNLEHLIIKNQQHSGSYEHVQLFNEIKDNIKSIEQKQFNTLKDGKYILNLVAVNSLISSKRSYLDNSKYNVSAIRIW